MSAAQKSCHDHRAERRVKGLSEHLLGDDRRPQDCSRGGRPPAPPRCRLRPRDQPPRSSEGGEERALAKTWAQQDPHRLRGALAPRPLRETARHCPRRAGRADGAATGPATSPRAGTRSGATAAPQSSPSVHAGRRPSTARDGLGHTRTTRPGPPRLRRVQVREPRRQSTAPGAAAGGRRGGGAGALRVQRTRAAPLDRGDSESVCECSATRKLHTFSG